MNAAREPFVSGLPGPGAVPAPPPTSLMQTIGVGRALLIDEIEELAPQCVSRYFGEQRTPPDAVAVERRSTCERLVAILDAIGADDALQTALALRLGRAGR